MLEDAGLSAAEARDLSKLGDPSNLLPTDKPTHAAFDQKAREINPNRNPELKLSLDDRDQFPLGSASNKEIQAIVDRLRQRGIDLDSTAAGRRLKAILQVEKQRRGASATWNIEGGNQAATDPTASGSNAGAATASAKTTTESTTSTPDVATTPNGQLHNADTAGGEGTPEQSPRAEHTPDPTRSAGTAEERAPEQPVNQEAAGEPKEPAHNEADDTSHEPADGTPEQSVEPIQREAEDTAAPESQPAVKLRIADEPADPAPPEAGDADYGAEPPVKQWITPEGSLLPWEPPDGVVEDAPDIPELKKRRMQPL